jgi:hypothetical protein
MLAKLARAPGTLPRIEVEPAKLRRSREVEQAQSARRANDPLSSTAVGRRGLEAHRAVMRGLAEKRSQAETEVSPPVTVNVLAEQAPMALPPGMRRFVDMHGTQLAPEGTPAGPALPFDPQATPQLPAPSEAPAGLPKGMRRFTSVTGTELALDAPAGPALPFVPPKGDAPPPSPVPRITLEQYARMRVELALYPAHKLDILRRHGIDDEQRCRLDGYWGARVREDASLRAAWNAHYAEHWTRLRDPQGGKR